ncbi:hypothetical protein I552_7713 [Mycobacterium xenopi 3993]|nr:hypothetical protein I552_7713 [Mycobacterium xenopi 3993]
MADGLSEIPTARRQRDPRRRPPTPALTNSTVRTVSGTGSEDPDSTVSELVAARPAYSNRRK